VYATTHRSVRVYPRPRTLLREYLGQGGLGVKRGRGFYDESG
jgi:3-hydroxyacyl-CoA dehydrogenase